MKAFAQRLARENYNLLVILVTFAVLLTFGIAHSQTSPPNDSVPIANDGWNVIGIFDTDEPTPQRVEVLEDQDGNIVVKKRTEKSKNKEEKPTAKNLPGRQAMWEIGYQIGAESASSQALQWEKNGVRGPFGQLYDGSPTNESKRSFGSDFTIGMHLPSEKLRRVMVGGTIYLDGTVVPTENNVRTSIPRSSGGYHVMEGIKHNWAAFADFDLVYFPIGKNTNIISAGYYAGQRQAEHFAANGTYWPDEVLGQVKFDQGLRVKYRFVLGDYRDKASVNFMATVRIGTDGSYRYTGGIGFMFGRKNAPKVVPEK